MTTFNIYCDESCHLEHDNSVVMVLGAIWASQKASKQAAQRIMELKERHGLSRHMEVKWVKVSKSRLTFYMDLVDYFFDNSELMFRSIVIPNKSKLKHAQYGQTHNDWYYKMQFLLVKQILERTENYCVYLDIKDSKSNENIARLHEFMCKSVLDFDRAIVKNVQQVRSHEVQLIQLSDLLIGAIGYANRNIKTSDAKLAIVERIRARSRLSLTKSTLPSERKMNLFRWSAQENG